MSENIASRVGRLISGTANMMVDAVENSAPEVVMEESIREIDRVIDEVRVEFGNIISTQHLATRRLADENAKHNDLTEKIQLALNEGREDLAEAAVSQVLDIEAQIPILENTIGETKDAEGQLEGYITALQGRKREMKEELSHFRAAQKSSPSSSGSSRSVGAGNAGVVENTVRKAEEAFDRALEGSSGVGGGAELPGRVDSAKRAELDELSRQNRIKERLASFKSEGA